jgi:hypothetical protein
VFLSPVPLEENVEKNDLAMEASMFVNSITEM